MKYKKLFTGLVLFFLAVVIGWNFACIFPKHETQNSAASVTFVLNTGESVATYDGVIAPTVYDALIQFASQTAIPIGQKHYDFGVFIESIGDKLNTKDNAWIYYVNGISGDMAADKKIIKPGDIVEWRYEKPLY
jgi:hypothetical protein